MKYPGRRRLVLTDLRRSWARLALAGFGIAVAAALLTFLLGLVFGVRDAVIGRMIPADQLEVATTTSSVDLGLLRLGLGSEMLTEDDMADLRALPGVIGVYPKLSLAVPAVASGGASLLGQTMVTEVVADGIDPALVSDDVGDDWVFAARPPPSPDLPRCVLDADCAPGTFCVDAPGLRGVCRPPVPIVIAENLVTLYNGTVRRAYDLPRLNPDAALGITAAVQFGASSFSGIARRQVLRERVRLVGFSDRAAPIGLTFPIEEIMRVNDAFAEQGQGGGFDSAILVLRNAAGLGDVAGRVRKLGFRVVSSAAERAAAIMGVAVLVLWLIGGAVVLVAALGVFHTFALLMEGRRREIAVLRAVGASAVDVLLILLGEAAVVGFAAGAVGVGIGSVLVSITNSAAIRALRHLPFIPDQLFALSPGLVVAVIGVATAGAVIGAAVPSWAAVRRPPAGML